MQFCGECGTAIGGVAVMEMTRDGAMDAFKDGSKEQLQDSMKSGLKDAVGLGDVSFEKPSITSMVTGMVGDHL